jgi:phosphatidylserine/phosphatidylglycerophosphate/cardiolipin synthase-like enzyme
MSFLRTILLSFLLFFSLSSASKYEAMECQVYFSPDDHVADRLIELIAVERTQILAAVYCFTHKEICKAFIDAKQRGVKVQLIVDPYSLSSSDTVAKMVDEGVEVFVWSPRASGKRAGLMHDKFCILGDDVVWTGSFNFTHPANISHQENVVVLRSAEVAASFKKQFELIKTRGCMTHKKAT